METRGKNSFAGVLTSLPLLMSLSLLILNDWFLKAVYGNWITGKLSDFAGICLLALLVLALLPRHRPYSAVAISLFFVWWKSPFSQSAIDMINSLGPPRIGRVVDYTDLMALVMVPVAWLLIVRREQRQGPLHSVRRVLAAPMGVACLAAMVATSPAFEIEVFEIREVSRPMTLNPATASATLGKVFGDLEMQCSECARPEKQGEFFGGTTEISYVFLEDGRIRFYAMYYPQGTLFPGAPGTSVRAFRDKLKSSLDEVLGEIELREFPEPFGSYTSPADSIQAKLIPGIFDEIATSNGLQRLSPGRYKRESASRGIRFWFRDDLTIEYTLDAGRVPIVREDIEEALRKRFSGLQFYHFDGNKYDLFTSYVDFEKASLIQTTE